MFVETDFTLTRAEPARVRALLTIGLLVGAVSGWAAAARVVRRMREIRRLGKSGARLAYICVMAAMTPATLINVTAVAIAYVTPYRPDSSPPPWIGYTIYGAEPLAYLGVMLLALGFVVVSLSRPRRSTSAVAAR